MQSVVLDARRWVGEARRARTLPWLSGIILLGLGLRLFRLGAWGIGLDEGVSTSLAALRVVNLIKFVADDTGAHPPLYYVFLHFWRLLGTNEALLRLPSMLFGVLTIWLVYALGAALVDRRAGLVAAFILAVSPLHIYHSQNLRMYSLLFLLTTASLYFFWRVLSGGRWREWSAYVVVTLLALYTHYGAFLIVAIENLIVAVFLVLRWKTPLRGWIAAQLAVAVGYLPWVVFFLGTLSRTTPVASAEPEAMAPLARFAWVLAAFSSDYLPTGTPVLKATIAAVFGLVALGGVLALKEKPQAALLLLFSSLGAMALAVLLAGSLTHESKTYLIIPRTLLPAAAGYYILIAAALTRRRARILSPTLLASLVLLNLYSYPNLYYKFVRAGPWKEVASYVVANAHPGDGIVFVSGFWARPFDFYFAASKTDLPVVRYHGAGSLPQVQTLSQQSDRIWLVLKQPSAVDPQARVRTYIQSTASLDAESIFWSGIRVELYTRR